LVFCNFNYNIYYYFIRTINNLKMSEYNYYLLGEENNLKEIEKILLNDFDINYIPLKNLPISYFSMNDINNLKTEENKNIINNILKKIDKEMNNKIHNFNNFNIYPIVIILIIFYIFLMIFILRIIQYYFPLYYIYILIGIIIILIIITSLWFLYINSNIL